VNETGGTNSVLKGNLKKRLVTMTIANVSPSGENPGTVNVQAVIKGLSSVLNIFAGVGACTVDSQGNLTPLPAASWPAGAGTMQITPQTFFGDRGKLEFRPVFQDPTAVDHLNHPLPQALPFSWNFPGECDEAVIDIVLDSAAWAGTGVHVQINLQVMAEYFGPWWDAKAYVEAMGQVQCAAPNNQPLAFSSL
jgi:hypothetical protein